MFKEEIDFNEEKGTFTITVSCDQRTVAVQPKIVYDKDVRELIPDNLMHKLKLMSSPVGPVSNIKYSSHVNVGKWVFEISQEAQPTSNTKKVPPKPRTRRKTQRK